VTERLSCRELDLRAAEDLERVAKRYPPNSRLRRAHQATADYLRTRATNKGD